jgi:hypothetical protein
MVYGNDFSSIIMPFRRYLSCKKCRLELPLKVVFNSREFKFKWADYNFNALSALQVHGRLGSHRSPIR